jgi:hypothetical protein
MRLRESLETIVDVSPDAFEDLRRGIDPEWILQALQATGTATVRSRRLPAEQVVWLVIGMALFRNWSIQDIVNKLDLALPGVSLTVASSSVVEARARLGAEPLEWLFGISADHWAHASARGHSWRGLALYGVDGTTLRVPDSKDNACHFGYSHSVRGESAYPMVRVVGLMTLRSHLLAAVTFGPYETGEISYAATLWPSIPRDSLTIVDRGFFSVRILTALARDRENRHWLIRAKKNLRWRTLQRLGPRDALVEMDVSKEARRKDPSLPLTWVMRAITYQRKGFLPSTLLTSLLDPVACPADEIAVLYHERWELELGYDEIKTELLDREEAIRSRTPTEAEAEAMFAAADDHGAVLVEAFPYMFQAQTLEIEQLIRSGAIGDVRLVFATFGFTMDDPGNIRLDAALGGGAVMDAGCYPVSFARQVFGARPERVAAIARFAHGVDQTLAATLEFAGGGIAQISCSFATAVHRRAIIAGATGVIETEYHNHTDRAAAPSYRIKRSLDWSAEFETVPVPAEDGFRAELEAFAALVMRADRAELTARRTASLDNAWTLAAIRAAAAR